MADLRTLLLNLADQFQDKANQSVNATINGPGNGDDNFVDSLDAIVNCDNQPERPHNTGITDDEDIIVQMHAYFKLEDKCRPAINANFAKAVCAGFRTKVSKEKQKELLDVHGRPENCPVLKTPRVNKAVWSNMTRSSRDSDVSLQILQSIACSVMYPLLTLLDKMHNAKRNNTPIFGSDLTSSMKLAMDSFKLVQLLYTDITYRRHEAIQPHLHKAYKDLCSEDTAVTDLLFGDELEKRIKELTDAKKYHCKVAARVAQRRTSRRVHVAWSVVWV